MLNKYSFGLQESGYSLVAEEVRFETLRVAFRLARAPNAYLSLDAFLTILCSASERAIEFNCPEAVNVTSDEMLFSSLITSLQLDENEDEAFNLIGQWLPPAAQRCGLVHCNALAQELRVGGHIFLAVIPT